MFYWQRKNGKFVSLGSSFYRFV